MLNEMQNAAVQYVIRAAMIESERAYPDLVRRAAKLHFGEDEARARAESAGRGRALMNHAADTHSPSTVVTIMP